MVGDYDVMCIECCESFCYDCIETYNPLSRLARLIAYANVASDVKLTNQDISDFIQDINSDEIQNYMKNEANEVQQNFNNKKEYLLELYNKNLDACFMNELINFLHLYAGDAIKFVFSKFCLDVINKIIS